MQLALIDVSGAIRRRVRSALPWQPSERRLARTPDAAGVAGARERERGTCAVGAGSALGQGQQSGRGNTAPGFPQAPQFASSLRHRIAPPPPSTYTHQ